MSVYWNQTMIKSAAKLVYFLHIRKDMCIRRGKKVDGKTNTFIDYQWINKKYII